VASAGAIDYLSRDKRCHANRMVALASDPEKGLKWEPKTARKNPRPRRTRRAKSSISTRMRSARKRRAASTWFRVKDPRQHLVGWRITAIMNILRSESTGSIHVSSKAPNIPPAIRFNFLSAQLDREVTLEAMRITRRIMTAPAMRGIATDEIAPGLNIQTDDELLDWVRNNAETTYHPVGTCKMGLDPMAVVDDQLRVRGMEGLRVADASIMPTLTSGNTNAPSIMIGEKASRMILAAA
jgi:choline dehydrogenase-like flavoprotein